MKTNGHGREAKRQTILKALNLGHTRRAAYTAAGISGETFYTWLSSDLTFSDAVARAEADGSVERLAAIEKAGEKDWRALAWIQEHSPATKQDWRTPGDVDLRKLTVEQLLALEAALAGEREDGVDSAGDRAAALGSSAPRALPE